MTGSSKPEVVVEAHQARDLAQGRTGAAGLDVVAGSLRLPDEDAEPAERRDVGEVQIGHMQVYGLSAVQHDAGKGFFEVFEGGDVGLAVKDDPGGVIVVDGLDSELLCFDRISK